MAVFPQAWMSELLSKSDIVSIVSDYVQLKPRGKNLWGCCPFHNEKTPSFSVTRDKQMYYCFGCHAGGSVVQFVMDMEKLTYVEAIKFLAQRAGMELPGEVDDERLRLERARMERLYAACRDAAKYFHTNLMADCGKTAREYLARRGLKGGTVKRFGLGWAIDDWEDLCTHMTALGYSQDELIGAGLALAGKKTGGVYDAFRNRVIFPIIATTGRVVGFGARTMGDEQPKYINTGETLIYNKRANLYALNLMKGKHISDIIMVEGYMDVISLHSAGVDNAVASLGTALTQQQARLIKRYVQNVFIAYDGDAAGQNATIRGMDILAKEGLDVRVISVPDGMDPDDYVRKNGREGFLSLKDNALSLNAFKLENIAGGFDLNTEDGREGYAIKACAFAGGLQPVERERYAAQIARKAGLAIETVKAQFGLTGAPAVQNSIAKNRHNRSENVGAEDIQDKTEAELICCMLLSKTAALDSMSALGGEGITFSNDETDELAGRLLAQYAVGDTLNAQLLAAESGARAGEIIASALSRSDILDPERTAAGCVNRMIQLHLTDQIHVLSLRAAGMEPDSAQQVIKQVERLTERLNKLK